MSSVNEMISESVNRMFLQRVDRKVLDEFEGGAWPAQLWQLVEESGFAEVMSAEAEGAEAWQNAYPIFHALGFHRVPLPLAETIIANQLLSLAKLAPRSGPLTLIEQDSRLALQLDDDVLVLNGSAASVPWARYAKHIIVSGKLGKRRALGVVEARAAGLTISRAQNIAHEPRDVLTFENTRCSEYKNWAETLPEAPVTLFGALARSVMMVGAAQSILYQSVQYANERVQFGRPIAKYQAIQHALATLAGEVACAQTAALTACQMATIVPEMFDVAVAKIRAGQAAGLSAAIAHQVHGAFGFTHEHTLHYATRRLWSWRAEYGAESTWAGQLGRRVIGRRGDGFWPGLVARQW